jgi:hypothetical protein
MSDTDTDDSERRATGTQATDTDRVGVQYGLLGPCVAFALLVGVGVGHYAALSVFCSVLRRTASTRSSGVAKPASTSLGKYLAGIVPPRDHQPRSVVSGRPTTSAMRRRVSMEERSMLMEIRPTRNVLALST